MCQTMECHAIVCISFKAEISLIFLSVLIKVKIVWGQTDTPLSTMKNLGLGFSYYHHTDHSQWQTLTFGKCCKIRCSKGKDFLETKEEKFIGRARGLSFLLTRELNYSVPPTLVLLSIDGCRMTVSKFASSAI